MIKNEKYSKAIYITIFISPIIIYFFYLSSFPMTYDELKRVHGASVDLNWLRQGRWGMYYLTEIYAKNPVFPFVGIYLSSVICGFTLVNLFRFSNYKCNFESLFISLLMFLSYPSLLFFYDFSTVSYSLGIIYILSYISTRLLLKGGHLYFLVSMFLLVISISIYQAAVTVFIVMVFISILFKNEVEIKKLIFRLFFHVSLSLIIYYLSIKFFIIINNVGINSYLSGFVQYDFDKKSLLRLVSAFFRHIVHFYLYPFDKFLTSNYFLPFLIFFSVIKFCIGNKKNIYSIFIIFIILLAPFLLNLLSPVDIPTRALIALPITISFFSFLLLNSCNKKTILLLFFLAIIFNVISINKLSFMSKNSWGYDQRVATMMLERIYKEPGYVELLDSGNEVPIHLVGYMKRKENEYNREVENIGKSFFSWGNNELLNIARILNTLGFDEFRFAEPSKLQSSFDKIREMPNWPNKGSIKVISGVVVVKLSDYSEIQVNKMCSSFDRINYPKSCIVSYNPGSILLSIDSNKTNLVDDTKNIISQSVTHNLLVIDDMIQPTNNDPQIILPKIKTSGKEALLFLRGSYSNRDSIEIFYKTKEKGNYKGSNMIRISVPKSKEEFSFSLSLPSNLFRFGLRVDPSINNKNIKDFFIGVIDEE